MAYTPGELLLRSGLIRPEQLTEAGRLQQMSGASFGECLTQIGAVDERTLADFYHRRLMVPLCDERRLTEAPRSAIRLVPADMAAEFRVLPLSTDAEDTLLLAMADPADNHAVDEVAFFSGRFIMRTVAETSALKRAIELHYGVQLPMAGRQPQLAAPPVQDAAPVELPPIEEPIILLNKVKKSDAALPRPSPPVEIAPSDGPTEPILLSERVVGRWRDTLRGFSAAVPDPPLAALRAAADRDEIAAVLLEYFSLLALRAALFVMRQGQLVGHDARGTELLATAVREITIPVTAPSLFRDVITSSMPYRGPMPETLVNRAFAQALGGVEGEVMVMPIAVRNRVLAVAFIDGMIQPFPDAAVHAACREVGLAYERFLLAKRAR
jgi:hypothetical protein